MPLKREGPEPNDVRLGQGNLRNGAGYNGNGRECYDPNYVVAHPVPLGAELEIYVRF